MEMKTRILLLGILSILYGLFVTDRKYPRTDKYGRISLNIHTAGTVNTEHARGGRHSQHARGGEGRVRRGPGEKRAERGVVFKIQMYSSTVV